MITWLLAATLGAAVGVDLALTLLFLGVLPPLLDWPAVPDALAGLESRWVVGPLVVLWAVEAWAEARSISSLAVWHGFQLVARPVAGGLIVQGAVGGGAAALAIGVAAAILGHAVASGWHALLHLRRVPRRTRLIAAAMEDAGVLAALALAFDRPWLAGALLLAAPAIALPVVRSALRTRRFVMAVLGHAVRRTLDRSGALTRPALLLGPGTSPPRRGSLDGAGSLLTFRPARTRGAETVTVQSVRPEARGLFQTLTVTSGPSAGWVLVTTGIDERRRVPRLELPV